MLCFPQPVENYNPLTVKKRNRNGTVTGSVQTNLTPPEGPQAGDKGQARE
jgi:hypothetical protein